MRARSLALAVCLLAAVPASASATVTITSVPTKGFSVDPSGLVHLAQSPSHFAFAVPDRVPCATNPGETCQEGPEQYTITFDPGAAPTPDPSTFSLVQPNPSTPTLDVYWSQPYAGTLAIGASHTNCITLAGDTTPYVCADLPDGLLKFPVSLDRPAAPAQRPATTQSSSSANARCAKLTTDLAFIKARLKAIATALKNPRTTAAKRAKLTKERATLTKRRSSDAKSLKKC